MLHSPWLLANGMLVVWSLVVVYLSFFLFNWFSQRKEPKMISCVIFFDVLMNGKQTQNKLKISKLVSQFCLYFSFFLFFF